MSLMEKVNGKGRQAGLGPSKHATVIKAADICDWKQAASKSHNRARPAYHVVKGGIGQRVCPVQDCHVDWQAASCQVPLDRSKRGGSVWRQLHVGQDLHARHSLSMQTPALFKATLRFYSMSRQCRFQDSLLLPAK